MTTTPQPAAPRRYVAIHEVSTDEPDVMRMRNIDERTALPTDDDGDTWVQGGSYVSPDDVVLVNPLVVEVLTDLPTLTRAASGWGREPTYAEKTASPSSHMGIYRVGDSVTDEHLLADIRTLVAAYLARKQPTSPAHAALERIAEEDGVLPEDVDLIRAALDKAARA